MTPVLFSLRTVPTCFRILFSVITFVLALYLPQAMGLTPESTETSATDLDPVVVTARGTPGFASQTPGSVGVVTMDEIDRTRPVSLTDITRFIPGVEKTTDSPWGSDINIRGLSRNSVLFLIDGCRINTATDINARFGLLNPEDIGRIEVLKGPISALYGWGAMGGVVNVITRKGEYTGTARTRGEIRAQAMSNPEGYGVYGTELYESPDAWFLGSGGYRDYAERKSAGETLLHNSQYRDVYGRFGTGCQWNAENETEINIQVMEGRNIGIPGKGLALSEGPDATYPLTRRILGSVTQTLTPEGSVLTRSRLRLFFQEVERKVRLDAFPSSAALVSAEPGADHATLGLNWTNHLSLGDHAPVVGFEVWQWKIDDTERIKTLKSGLTGIDSSLGKVAQAVGGIFVEDTWPVSDRLELNLGGRLDATRVKSDDLYNWISPPSPAIRITRVREGEIEEDASFQGQIGLTWQVGPRWSATGVAATSFRPPDLMDRFKYVSLGSGVSLYGNPDLEPEQSLFFETGVHYISRNLRITGALYCNRLRDMITEHQVSATRIEMENIDRARIYGSELSGEWRIISGLRARTSLAWTRGDNQTTGEALPYISPLNTRVSLVWEEQSGKAAKGWWGELTHEWAAAQDRVPSGQTGSESWQTLDLSAGCRFRALTLDHELSFGVANLLNEDYSNFLATSRGLELKEAGISLFCHYKVQF
ncbi:TonB-dependent receptor plug domain-containing protein [Desulfospira joergensenii]|uniref:TonB-dependent receptor plug domain-containing protein n=1 Tax=Desulfospira joergensenii TaxID=53329 RepID=UPI0003B5B402|nr:TonB-dependent receptor [Desulfospira joergensenii]